MGDIISTAQLAASLKKQGHCVSTLVFKEFEPAAKLVASFSNIYCINRHRIETFSKSQLFYNGLALDQLYRDIKDISATQWDQIINISNDPLSARLASFLSDNRPSIIRGCCYRNDHNIYSSSDWAIFLNEIVAPSKNSPMHFTGLYYFIQELTPQAPTANNDQLNHCPRYDQQTQESLKAIKEQFGKSSNSKIIGIQAKSSCESKDIPFSTLASTIKMIRQSDADLIPLIIIAPNTKERELARRLNEKFNQELIIVEANLSALVSIVAQLDLLLTPDTLAKHIADASHVRSLEISLGNAPLTKQGSKLSESAILSYRLDLRGVDDRDRHLLRAEDIYHSILYLVDNRETPSLSDNFTLYQVKHDALGASFLPVAGDFCLRSETFRMLARNYIERRMLQNQNTERFAGFQEVAGTDLFNFLNQQKVGITNAMKSLLATLRSLKRAKSPNGEFKSFINLVDHLIELSNETHLLTHIPLKFFQYHVENMDGSQSRDNAIEFFEQRIFQLKDELQLLLKTIDEFEHYIGQSTRSSSRSKRRSNSDLII